MAWTVAAALDEAMREALRAAREQVAMITESIDDLERILEDGHAHWGHVGSVNQMVTELKNVAV